MHGLAMHAGQLIRAMWTLFYAVQLSVLALQMSVKLLGFSRTCGSLGTLDASEAQKTTTPRGKHDDMTYALSKVGFQLR